MTLDPAPTSIARAISALVDALHALRAAIDDPTPNR